MAKLVKAESGLTFIEWAIMVAVVGIIAALAFPYVQDMQEKAREAATKTNIAAIKAAISIYYGDHEGIWPTTLDVSDKTPGYGFGDYLPIMPKVKVRYPSDPALSPAGSSVTNQSFSAEPSLAESDTPGKGWRYDGPQQSNTGRIWVNSSLTDSTGVSYTTYGYQ